MAKKMRYEDRFHGAESSIRVALLEEGWQIDNYSDGRVDTLIQRLAAALAKREPALAELKERFIQEDDVG